MAVSVRRAHCVAPHLDQLGSLLAQRRIILDDKDRIGRLGHAGTSGIMLDA